MAYTLTTKSQVTLPKPIREHLKVAPGDAVEFTIRADGSVQVQPARAGRSGEPSAAALSRVRKLIGSRRSGTSTDEWMNLLRGYDEDAADPGFAAPKPALRPRGEAQGATVILVDTCVLIDIAEGDAQWADWSARQLALWGERGPVVISPMVFAEWSSMFGHVDEVDSAVTQFRLTWQELLRAALFLASQAHKLYRRRGGARAMVLPDFLIGAHAAVLRAPVLTRDPRRFNSYFSGLQIVCPD